MDSEGTRARSSDGALPSHRRSEVVRLLHQQGQITVTELCERFAISADTARRDLDFLSQRGLVNRTHGGAVPVHSLVGSDMPFAQRLVTRVEAKERIGRAAAALLADGETLIINGGSTAVAFGRALGGLAKLTVVTNNLMLPTVLPLAAMQEVHIVGGQLRFESQVAIGPFCLAGCGAISVDSAIIGVGGVSASGISTTSVAEAAMIKAMIDCAGRTIVIADSSKFGHNSFAGIAPLDRMHVLVTDAPPADLLAAALEEARVDVIVAPDGRAGAG